MHEKDLAMAWDRWCRGATVLVIAMDLGVSSSRLHRELQGYLGRRQASVRPRELGVVAA